eukprot:scaffold2924_cov165-Ochromonas_danica.AAC.3
MAYEDFEWKGRGQSKAVGHGGRSTLLQADEARIASYLGKGFYTIGPCGEELLGLTSLHLTKKDVVALHYRHVANSVVRQLRSDASTATIALNRARGFACSIHDPVTSGRHCSIGGNFKNEFIVTSTLSSQCTPALGRAIAIPYSQHLLGSNAAFASDAISYVSIGDGSASNAHFLSALNMSKYCLHNRLKCPLLFVITDNNLSISLRNQGYTKSFVEQLEGLEKETANGRDFLDIYGKAGRLVDYVRTYKRPALLYVHSLPRRFGHAATDRQGAYLSENEISQMVGADPLSETFSALLGLGLYQPQEIDEIFHTLQEEVEKAFDQAVEEPKVSSRESLVASTSGPLYSLGGASLKMTRHLGEEKEEEKIEGKTKLGEREVMRKLMTRFYDEALDSNKRVVYIGEDVRHGGYYLVTDGLAGKYPTRVLDFPPDETSLIGIGMGMAQAGLVPIVEIPYAKYLDCGLDIFYEAVISHWLSNGKQPTGMLVRLQGFDRGIFGGNYHTHNILSCQAPGLDMVCFSNGRDYVRGMRYCLAQVEKSQRVVMVVDSTDLLNRRHVDDNAKDEGMLHRYRASDEPYDFDQVIVYPADSLSDEKKKGKKGVVVVTYGNGVGQALQAQKTFAQLEDGVQVTVIDSPCLSQTPAQLLQYLRDHRNEVAAVVFADVCKYTPTMPLAKMAVDLQNAEVLEGLKWKVVGAAPTYNPLGSYLTFLSKEDIVTTINSLTAK